MSITSSSRIGAAVLAASLCALPCRAEVTFDRLGEPAPELTVAPGTLLSSLRGRWVLLHFWATWCEPCREELPALDRFASRSAEVFTFATVAMDGSDRVAVDEYRARAGLALPVMIEADAGAASVYTTWGLPATYFIAPDGRVAGRALGLRDWDDADAATLRAALIGGD